MVKLSSILGKNARSQLFSYLHNTTRGKRIATSKLLAKRVLKEAGIPVPSTFKIFKNPKDIMEFDWNSLPDSFALKPNKGLGGEGIIVVKKRAEDGEGWITINRKKNYYGRPKTSCNGYFGRCIQS